MVAPGRLCSRSWGSSTSSTWTTRANVASRCLSLLCSLRRSVSSPGAGCHGVPSAWSRSDAMAVSGHGAPGAW
jgi:hypothetical protein